MMKISANRVVRSLCGLLVAGCNAPSVGPSSASVQPPVSTPPVMEVGKASAPLFQGHVVTAQHVAPIVGGTLLVTRSGKTIAVADPDRDAVFLVDTTSHTVRTIALSPGDEPGRVAEGPEGTLYVALRRAGALLAIDEVAGRVISRVPVCAAPRGLAYDANSSRVHVACRSGQLLTLDATSLAVQRSIRLDPDLRDVIVRDHDLVVTRFLSAEVMLVASDGTISKRATPSPQPGCADANVAYRALGLPGGQIAVAHQSSTNDVVSETEGGYGFSCGGALVTRFLTLVNVDKADPGASVASGSAFHDPEGDVSPTAMTFDSVTLPAAGPLDVAFDANSKRIAAIAVDDSLVGQGSPIAPMDLRNPTGTLWLASWDGATLPAFGQPDSADGPPITVPGQPVAVAFDANGKYIVQSREPATLEFERGSSVHLSPESHADSGQTMFYMNSGIGISCSSCHPEGGEDGHTWQFSEGPRRTLSLEGGVLERAPFHWDGTLPDMGSLVSEVMLKRMAFAALPSPPQVEALATFLEQLPNAAPAEDLDAAQVARGRALFARADVACASCHSGAQYTNNQLADVGTGGTFVTPSLLGVGLRSALFHDGCARSVSERFGACGGTAHGKPELLSADERASLVAFLRSL